MKQAVTRLIKATIPFGITPLVNSSVILFLLYSRLFINFLELAINLISIFFFGTVISVVDLGSL